MNTAIHNHYMKQAIELAKKGQLTTSPNPNVGCVIVYEKQVIGEGYHQKTGLAHAEVNALNQAKQYHVEKLAHATAYVTLEPCCHFGHTPPCAQALIDAKIKRVVIGSTDPNPKVLGKGAAILEQAGIEVITNIMTAECDALNTGFFHRMINQKPWVSLKLGMSLDAKIATQTGESQWITGELARKDVHFLRAKMDGILTTAKTAITDNPQLNVRLPSITDNSLFSQPKKVIVDTLLSMPPELSLFQSQSDVLIYHSKQLSSSNCYPSNTQLIGLPIKKMSDSHYMDLNLLLTDLAINHQFNHVLIEAGGAFAGTLIKQQLVDELIIYMAPKLLGNSAKSAFDFEGSVSLAQASNYQLTHSESIGQDIKAVYRKLAG